MKVEIDFSKLGSFCAGEKAIKVIPVVVQDVLTKEVLIIAYVNEEALNYSLKNNLAVFWSTSRNELWVKGLTSGSFLELVEVRVNCEQNSLLYLVKPVNGCGACHVKDENGKYQKSCFYRGIILENGELIIKKINKEKKK
jgi:phosphoribosyl-AMP cyclohydrolase